MTTHAVFRAPPHERFRLSGLFAAALIFTLLPGCIGPSPKLIRQNLISPNPPQTGELHARFFGVSTVLISDGKTHLMVDGFFSRPGLGKLVVGRLESKLELVQAALTAGEVSALDAVFVAHSHHDHALDSMAVADLKGATIFGSDSTRNIVRGQNPSFRRFREVRDGAEKRFGDFCVHFFASPHSPCPLFPGTIAAPLASPARLRDFKCAENYTYLLRHPAGRILIVPSANFSSGFLRGVKADVVFLSVGLLGKQKPEFIRQYWRETISEVGAKLVVLIHWDDFTRPLAASLRPMPYLFDNLNKSLPLLQELARDDNVPLGFMPLYTPLGLAKYCRPPDFTEETPCAGTNAQESL